MPILTEDVLNQYGHLTVEQFLQHQCEAQVTHTTHLCHHCTTLLTLCFLSLSRPLLMGC